MSTLDLKDKMILGGSRFLSNQEQLLDHNSTSFWCAFRTALAGAVVNAKRQSWCKQYPYCRWTTKKEPLIRQL
jgi:hypothetical protein